MVRMNEGCIVGEGNSLKRERTSGYGEGRRKKFTVRICLFQLEFSQANIKFAYDS